MSATVSVAAALGSALGYAAAGVLQHRAVTGADRSGRIPAGWVARLLARPLWLAGAAADIAGLALHVAALSSGELAVVQVLLVTGLLFALPLEAVIDRRRPARRELTWAAALTAGLAAFLVVGSPSAGTTPTDTDLLAGAVVGGVGLAALTGVVAVRLRAQRAALLGSVAGIAYGLTAALLKASVHLVAGGHPSRLLSSWIPYALVGIGATALGVTQAAFSAGPLAASLPPLTVLDPLVAVALGVAVFHERLVTEPGAVVAEVAAAALMGLAAVKLARLTGTSRTSGRAAGAG